MYIWYTHNGRFTYVFTLPIGSNTTMALGKYILLLFSKSIHICVNVINRYGSKISNHSNCMFVAHALRHK